MMAGSLSDLSIQIEKGPILIKYRAFIISGAGNQIRTGDLNLGKVALYQLSYARLGAPILRPPGVVSTLILVQLAVARQL